MTRVLLLSDSTLFGRGVESLLSRENLDIVGYVESGDELQANIESLHPDVVILDCSDAEQDPTPALMRCLRDGLVQKIISLNVQDSSFCVYSSDRCQVAEIEDFVARVRDLF
jgi:DNA-binding NarL/FixJ family response regulator